MQIKSDIVGMVGVGLMGHGIAANIAKSGRKVLFLDHPGNQDTTALQALGAEPLDTAAKIAQRSDVVIICVTGTPQVEDVLFSADGILEGLTPNTVIIDCSTAIPSSSVKIGERVEVAGGYFLDAPMTRTPKEAAEGRLNLIVGGDTALFEACLPLFETYAENIVHAGHTGTGHTLKLIHNYVSLGFSAVLAEAARAAEVSNVSPETLLEVLENGAGAGAILQRFKPYLADKTPDGFAFAIANGAKDMGYYSSMAEEISAPGGVAGSVQATYDALVASGDGAKYIPEMIDRLK